MTIKQDKAFQALAVVKFYFPCIWLLKWLVALWPANNILGLIP
jgi:hypothetical protein